MMEICRKSGFCWAALFVLSLSGLVIGCQPEQAEQAEQAPGQVEIESADPGFTKQGAQNIDVTVKGEGFEPGAEVRFFVTGTEDAGGITVNSTRFVDSNTLVGNIDVAPDATTGTYDVLVQVSGRTGKGVEVFGIASN
jgi:hypothetical protein